MELLTSWVQSANSPETEFPLNNLPYGVFSVSGRQPHCGVAIGNMILDVTGAEKAGVLAPGGSPAFNKPSWNKFMALGPQYWAQLRQNLIQSLSKDSKNKSALEPYLVNQSNTRMHMPFAVAEFTDFYAGKYHAQNMGRILRGAPDLPANWSHIPIGYNGRASSVVVSGTDIHRPLGQTKARGFASPCFGPTKKLDFELEVGAVVGTGSTLGQPVSLEQADRMIFGYVLLNDWSARDIQSWEYQPLGPFQGKAFGTTISPWIVTAEALESFRTAIPAPETTLLPYLTGGKPGLYDIQLEVFLRPKTATEEARITKTKSSNLHYSAAQQLCHHAVGGCPMTTGDLLGSGTISGPERDEFGSLMELSWDGRDPIALPTGEVRSFVEDGDTVTLRGYAQGTGYKIGFGDCTGKILPAIETPDWTE